MAHHHHGHHHHHAEPAYAGRTFALAVGLNAVFVLAEFGYGVMANSTALIADAGHNLSDVLGLLLAWGAAALARRPPSARYTYGLRSSSILAALANALLLLLACGGMAWEALQRLSAPPTVAGWTVTGVAAMGIVVNGLSAWLFAKGSKGDLNQRGAYLHLLADAAVSLGVVIAGLLMMGTGWYWLDPAICLLIVVVIVVGTWSLLREATGLALSAVPAHIDLEAVRLTLSEAPGVAEVHDLHVWGMSTTECALTAQLVMPDGYPGDAFMDGLSETLRKRHGIVHSTLQFGQGTTPHRCALHSGAGYEPEPEQAHGHGCDHDH